MAEYLIKTKDLEDGPKEYQFPIRSSWLAQELAGTDLSAATADGHVRVTASKSGADVVLQGSAQAPVVAPCARCLEDVELPLETDLTMLIAHVDPHAPKEELTEELTPEELARETFSGDEVVLDDIVRENLILEVPMVVHCSRPVCVERWEGSGSSRGIKRPDPRLAGLADLKDKLFKKGS